MRVELLTLLTLALFSVCCSDGTPGNRYFNESMINSVWKFQSTCPNGVVATTTIEVQPAPSGSGLDTVWHYTKSDVCTYWNPGDQSELWFGLNKSGDGSWSSTKFEAICQFCIVGNTQGSVTIKTSGIGGYMVIPPDRPTSTTGQSGYFPCWTLGVLTWQTDDCNVAGEAPIAWRTDGYMAEVSTPAYTGPALVSEQQEGNCPESCTHEKWYFAPNLGIVEIEQLERVSTRGVVVPEPPTTLVRVN